MERKTIKDVKSCLKMQNFGTFFDLITYLRVHFLGQY